MDLTCSEIDATCWTQPKWNNNAIQLSNFETVAVQSLPQALLAFSTFMQPCLLYGAVYRKRECSTTDNRNFNMYSTKFERISKKKHQKHFRPTKECAFTRRTDGSHLI
jgi:hypothetical protein